MLASVQDIGSAASWLPLIVAASSDGISLSCALALLQV